MSERVGPGDVGPYARRVEAMGYDGLLVPEAVHDGLLTSMAAVTATERLRVVTSVLVAFAQPDDHRARRLGSAEAVRWSL
ncbi:MAG: hypothetical protein ABGX04_07650 [Myxococcales bacterium]